MYSRSSWSKPKSATISAQLFEGVGSHYLTTSLEMDTTKANTCSRGILVLWLEHFWVKYDDKIKCQFSASKKYFGILFLILQREVSCTLCHKGKAPYYVDQHCRFYNNTHQIFMARLFVRWW
jgi:hypothetical protein